MDLLVEKLDGSRYYLSQYKVLITEFEESAPTVARNNMQLDQRNGNIDFGGWHKDKTINITGYYRADDMDDEEALREKLYALLSDPNGYYITQLKASPSVAMERPGETSGGYYDKLSNYPSHKRFLVYTESPELELVGNVDGTLLYKLTAEFKTMKLPYGETPALDIAIDSPYKGVPANLVIGSYDSSWSFFNNSATIEKVTMDSGEVALHVIGTSNSSGFYILYNFPSGNYTVSVDVKGTGKVNRLGWEGISDAGVTPTSDWQRVSITGSLDGKRHAFVFYGTMDVYFRLLKVEEGTTASPWSPNPSDSGYNYWYYSLDGNSSIPYSGTVPCNQLEQQFAIEITAKGTASSLSFKIDDTEFTYNGAVASGDVFLLTGFSYTKNGLSIVSKTNKAYFVLQPDKPNRITCNVLGTVRIIGFQNLYA